MGSKMLIDASHPEETRVVVIKGNRIEEFDFESAARKQLKGNIYLAKVTRVEPSLQAAFVEYGGNRHGFLAFSEIHPDYYQIPLADRMALIAAEEEEHAQADEDEDDEDNGRRSRSRDRGRNRNRNDQRAQGGETSARSGDAGNEVEAHDDEAHDDEGGVDDVADDQADDVEEIEFEASEGHSEDDENDDDEAPDAAVSPDDAPAVSSSGVESPADEGHDTEDNGSEDNGSDDKGPDDGTPPRSWPLATSHDEPKLIDEQDAVDADEDNGAAGDHAEPEDHTEAAAAEAAASGDDDAAEEIAPAPRIEHGMPGELGNGIEEVGEDPETARVESIGAEDALEEVPQRRRKVQRRQYKIQEVIKRRQVILVQVVKEERGNKGAALTTYLSLAGRYCVLMPNTARGGGISRKITDAGDRRRLKEVAKEIEVPQGMGLIVRTAGAQRTKTEIKRDYDYLLRLWESVRDLTLRSQAPALVYEEGSLVKRAIRDLYTKDVDEVIVEGDEAHREAKDFMKMLMPSHSKNVKSYKDTRPLFSRYQAESQLDGLYSPTVTLPSGGYMVINQTEALVSVDINSGKATREHNIEDTALKTNLEASDEIARQLRLRDLAGLVVIDFIDMEEKRNNRAVERRLKDALKNDRARIQVGHISHFGLLEMSRQRLRPGLLEGSSRTCPHCEGRGIVRSISSCGLSVLRAIEEHLIARKPENLTVKCTREIAFYILNEKRDNLLSIETTYGISVFIVPSDELKGSQAVIERAPERNIPPRKVIAAPVRIDSAFAEDEEDEDAQEDVSEIDETEAEENEAEGAEDGDEAEGGEAQATGSERSSQQQNGNGDREGGRKRRRRRGRRGGRGREGELNGQPQTGGEPRAEGGEIPGLGDQPDVGISAAGDDEADGDVPVAAVESMETGADEAAEGDAAASAGADSEPREERRDGSSNRSRRDRWGRHRDRNRGRGESADHGEAKPEAEASAEARGAVETEHAPARMAAPVTAEPAAGAPAPSQSTEAAAPAEPARRWQPPAPTVQAEPGQRKTGWWSKK